MILIQFLGEIIQSAVNPLFFRKAVQRSAGRAFGYYLYFTTLYTLVLCGAGFWWLSHNWNPTLNQLEKIVPAFQIQVDQGHFSTTLPNPSVLGDTSFALIIDTRDTRDATGQVTDLSPYASAIVISKTKAVLKKDKFETREYSFSVLPDFKLTTADVIGWLRNYKATILWTLFTTLGLAIVPTIWLFAIPVILFLMLLMMIPAKIIRSNLSYTQVLSIGFYGVTFPTLLQTYLWTQGPAAGNLHRWVYLVWCLAGVIAARSCGKAESSAPTAAGPPPPAP